MEGEHGITLYSCVCVRQVADGNSIWITFLLDKTNCPPCCIVLVLDFAMGSYVAVNDEVGSTTLPYTYNILNIRYLKCYDSQSFFEIGERNC